MTNEQNTTEVSYEQCHEYETHSFVTEASTLQLPVGAFPSSLHTAMGNGQPFWLCGVSQDGMKATYTQEFGCIRLAVFND